jgi:hypothetical protein
MNRFDVIVYTIRRRRGRRRPFEVRWKAAGRPRSKSFITRALADSYRAELVRATRKGLEFDPQSGEPVLWAEPEPVSVTWYQHAAAYAAMKWPALAAHSRASVAEALATVTPALTRAAPGWPPAAQLRAALYQHAFNPARTATADPATIHVLAWALQASLPVARLADPLVLRRALDALTLRLDGSRAAANTITRKRAVFHGALGFAVEAGLLNSNPVDSVSWQVPKTATTVDPKVVASPSQAEALHAALSLWLNAGAAPAQIAQRAGHSTTMLLAVYTHCIDGQDDITNRQIEHALHARNQAQCPKASGSANRRYPPPILSAICPCMAHTRAPGRLPAIRAHPRPELPASITDDRFRSSEGIRGQQLVS